MVSRLAPDVVDIVTTFGYDSTEEPAAFFMVILADAATGPDRLLDVANKVQDRMVQQIEPLAKWDVLPYFNFRSKSEQEKLDRQAVA